MELWGGHECTVNRVGNQFRDQTMLTGHQDRLEDLTRFAALGIKKLRYPVLWERVAPDAPDQYDWNWTDERLGEIARLGMQPIVGLLHHGSGPRYTSLVSDNFVELFTAYAASAAKRYPHVSDWTPVNEPLTTARFSALYGFWFPHTRDERLFWKALLNQVDATRAAMEAIRQVNPEARLVQTEDLGQYYSTPELASTAEHFNLRRWITWDLLTGRVRNVHPLWPHLDGLGFGDRLRAIADRPCAPDVIGINYYPTSERFLDHRLDAYPYAPTEEGYHELTAARVMDPPAPGLAGLMRQAWDRYGLPLAVTESHLGCSREEQLRWLWQSWQACRGLAALGVDVRAFTAWALLGNVDWNSLITVDAGHYEPGAFDVRGDQPRATAIAHLIHDLGNGVDPTPASFPAIEGEGWWQRSIRLEHAPFIWNQPVAPTVTQSVAQPILITGATGTLGQALARECELRGLPYLLTDRATLPIDDRERVEAFLDEYRPWAVINAAGWVRVDDAEVEPASCFRANRDGATMLAKACAKRHIRCTIFSSDLVFDGQQHTPYLEEDEPRAINVYGQSKMDAEAFTVRQHPEILAIRTAAFFSPNDSHNFAMAVEQSLRDGSMFFASADHVVSPAFVPDLVKACLDLVVDNECGIWHLANQGAVSWLDFGRMIARSLALDPALVQPATPSRLGWRAERPRYSVLGSQRGAMLPSLGDAIARHASEREVALLSGAMPDAPICQAGMDPSELSSCPIN